MEVNNFHSEADLKVDYEELNPICRCCLSTDRNMKNVLPYEPYFRDLAGFSVMESDGLPQWLCLECIALLLKAVRFKQKMLRAHNLLYEYLTRCAPFPIDAQDPELSKYASPHLAATNVLICNVGGRGKTDFQECLLHKSQPLSDFTLDAPHPVLVLPPPPSPLPEEPEQKTEVKEEQDEFNCDYDDDITLEEYRTSTKLTDEDIKQLLEDSTPAETLEEPEPKRKKKTKKKDAKGKKKKNLSEDTPEVEEPKPSIRKREVLDPTKIRVITLNPEEQHKQRELMAPSRSGGTQLANWLHRIEVAVKEIKAGNTDIEAISQKHKIPVPSLKCHLHNESMIKDFKSNLLAEISKEMHESNDKVPNLESQNNVQNQAIIKDLKNNLLTEICDEMQENNDEQQNIPGEVNLLTVLLEPSDPDLTESDFCAFQANSPEDNFVEKDSAVIPDAELTVLAKRLFPSLPPIPPLHTIPKTKPRAIAPKSVNVPLANFLPSVQTLPTPRINQGNNSSIQQLTQSGFEESEKDIYNKKSNEYSQIEHAESVVLQVNENPSVNSGLQPQAIDLIKTTNDTGSALQKLAYFKPLESNVDYDLLKKYYKIDKTIVGSPILQKKEINPLQSGSHNLIVTTGGYVKTPGIRNGNIVLVSPPLNESIRHTEWSNEKNIINDTLISMSTIADTPVATYPVGELVNKIECNHLENKSDNKSAATKICENTNFLGVNPPSVQIKKDVNNGHMKDYLSGVMKPTVGNTASSQCVTAMSNNSMKMSSDTVNSLQMEDLYVSVVPPRENIMHMKQLNKVVINNETRNDLSTIATHPKMTYPVGNLIDKIECNHSKSKESCALIRNSDSTNVDVNLSRVEIEKYVHGDNPNETLKGVKNTTAEARIVGQCQAAESNNMQIQKGSCLSKNVNVITKVLALDPARIKKAKYVYRSDLKVNGVINNAVKATTVIPCLTVKSDNELKQEESCAPSKISDNSKAVIFNPLSVDIEKDVYDNYLTETSRAVKSDIAEATIGVQCDLAKSNNVQKLEKTCASPKISNRSNFVTLDPLSDDLEKDIYNNKLKETSKGVEDNTVLTKVVPCAANENSAILPLKLATDVKAIDPNKALMDNVDIIPAPIDLTSEAQREKSIRLDLKKYLAKKFAKKSRVVITMRSGSSVPKSKKKNVESVKTVLKKPTDNTLQSMEEGMNVDFDLLSNQCVIIERNGNITGDLKVDKKGGN